jgi:hypothetical protein
MLKYILKKQSVGMCTEFIWFRLRIWSLRTLEDTLMNLISPPPPPSSSRYPRLPPTIGDFGHNSVCDYYVFDACYIHAHIILLDMTHKIRPSPKADVTLTF